MGVQAGSKRVHHDYNNVVSKEQGVAMAATAATTGPVGLRSFICIKTLATVSRLTR
jgi:hypothetical protein